MPTPLHHTLEERLQVRPDYHGQGRRPPGQSVLGRPYTRSLRFVVASAVRFVVAIAAGVAPAVLVLLSTFMSALAGEASTPRYLPTIRGLRPMDALTARSLLPIPALAQASRSYRAASTREKNNGRPSARRRLAQEADGSRGFR